VDIRINLSPVSDNRTGSKDSSVSLVMQSRENRKGEDPVAANCRTVVSSTRGCPSPLTGHVKEKPSHILGCLHGTTDSEAGDTESKILSYQKISVIPEASTPGNAPLGNGVNTSKVDETRAHRRGCFSNVLPCSACAPCKKPQPRQKRRSSFFSCCFYKIRSDCKPKAEAG
jgi:hypothetical protein